jgi:hypothetical protein
VRAIVHAKRECVTLSKNRYGSMRKTPVVAAAFLIVALAPWSAFAWGSAAPPHHAARSISCRRRSRFFVHVRDELSCASSTRTRGATWDGKIPTTS